MQKQPIWNARNDPCVPLLHLLVLPFVIPLSRCCRLRLVRACLESTAFTDNIESFGGFDSDLANAGVHTAYAAVLEFRPASVALIFHVQPSLISARILVPNFFCICTCHQLLSADAEVISRGRYCLFALGPSVQGRTVYPTSPLQIVQNLAPFRKKILNAINELRHPSSLSLTMDRASSTLCAHPAMAPAARMAFRNFSWSCRGDSPGSLTSMYIALPSEIRCPKISLSPCWPIFTMLPHFVKNWPTVWFLATQPF